MSSIEEAICIQLAKFNDTEKSVSNARWSNHNKQPVTINQGDTISITKSFIDTRNLSSAGIVILEDTPLELEMWFYWINDNPGSLSTGLDATYISGDDQSGAWWNPASAGEESWKNYYSPPHYTLQMTLQSIENIEFTTDTVVANTSTQTSLNSQQAKAYADGRPYLLIYTDGKPYTQTWKYTLKAGTYSPDALATLLTTAMAEVRKDTAESLNKPNAVDWFDPYTPKVNLPKTLDQPFIVNTNGSPPIWAISKFITDGDNKSQFSIINAQPYLQVVPNDGLPTNWFQGTVGSIINPDSPIGHPATPGPPPKPSLCFKNIISDCPIPNPSSNLPPFPNGPTITADKMAVGGYYEIITLGNTLWNLSGDLDIPPAVGDQFICTKPGTVPPDKTIIYSLMHTGLSYAPTFLGLPYLNGTTYIGYGYDTPWNNMGFGVNPTIGTNYVNTGVVYLPIPVSQTPALILIVKDITFEIATTSNLIDWGALGGPVTPTIGPADITIDNLVKDTLYKVISPGTSYGNSLIPNINYDTNFSGLAEGGLIGNTNSFVYSGTNTNYYPVNGNMGPDYTAINATQLLEIGNTITILTDTNPEAWVDWGFDNVQKLISYTLMTKNNLYTISNPGFAYLNISQFPDYQYDTPWVNMGFPAPQVGTTNINNGVVSLPIPLDPVSNVSTLAVIIQNVTFEILSSSDLINWEALGGPANPTIGSVVTFDNLQLSALYSVVSYGTPYGYGNPGFLGDTNVSAFALTDPSGSTGNTNYFLYNGNDASSNYPVNGLIGTIPAVDYLQVGNTISITSDTNSPPYDWTVFGYNPNQAILWSDMILGNSYTIVSLGLPWNANNPALQYDTNWIGFSENPTVAVGYTFTYNGAGPVDFGSDITLINTGITYQVTGSEPFIDWAALGGPTNPPDEDPFQVTPTSIFDGVSYIVVNPGTDIDTNWFSLLGIPFQAGLTIPVGFRFIGYRYQPYALTTFTDLQTLRNSQINVAVTITEDTNPPTNWTPYGYTGEFPATMPISFELFTVESPVSTLTFVGYVNSGASVQILPDYDFPFTFTATGNGDNTGVQAAEIEFQATAVGTGTVSSAGVPLTFTITKVPSQPLPFDNGVGFVVPTATFQEIDVVPTPFTFSATTNGKDILLPYTGNVIGTGTVLTNTLPPFTFTITKFPQAVEPFTTGTGFVVPTATFQAIGDVTVPFTFTATETGPDLALPYTGIILGTGEVNFGDNPQGTCCEQFNPISPNYYLYPLKLTSNPTFSKFTGLTGKGGGVFNYTFPLVGSTEISLVFNDLANIFQWEYTHSPIQQATAPDTAGLPVSFTEVVGIVNSFLPDPNVTTETTGQGFTSSTCKLVSKSGCMFRRMEPASFWQGILGFSPDLIVTDEELGIGKIDDKYVIKQIALPLDRNRFTYERFNSVTTRGLLTSAMNFNSNSTFPNIEESYIDGMFYNNPVTAPVQLAYSSVVDVWYSQEMAYNFIVEVLNSNTTIYDNVSTLPYNTPYSVPPPWNEAWYQALATTVTIDAIQPPTLLSDTYGHYLLEIEGYNSSLLNEQQKYGVKAIVSSYYNNIGSFTTLPFNDSAFLYQHVGESITLNNFRVRILDGRLNEVEGLGENSCVYLQINKSITPVEVQQV